MPPLSIYPLPFHSPLLLRPHPADGARVLCRVEALDRDAEPRGHAALFKLQERHGHLAGGGKPELAKQVATLQVGGEPELAKHLAARLAVILKEGKPELVVY